MRKLYFIGFVVGALLFGVACSRTQQDKELCDKVRLHINSSLEEAEPGTKGPITAATGSMPVGSSYGMFLCQHYDGDYTDHGNPYTEHALRYNNIRAYYDAEAPEWLYNYSGYSSFPILYVVTQSHGLTADLFGYAPHINNVSSPEVIPFNVLQQPDMMYAIENADPSDNKGINPMSGSATADATLTFRHAMSLLVFSFSLANSSYQHPEGGGGIPSYSFESLTVSRSASATTPLYKSGTMDAVNGGAITTTSYDETEEMRFVVGMLDHLYDSNVSYRDDLYRNYSRVLSYGSPLRIYLMLVPVDYAKDGDYIFNFKFSGQDLTSEFRLKQEYLLHSDGITRGLQPGYKYTFNFLVENYVHLSDITIGTWTVADDVLLEADI